LLYRESKRGIMKVTICAIKADVGSIGGHIKPSEKLLKTIEDFVKEKGKGLLIDYSLSHEGSN